MNQPNEPNPASGGCATADPAERQTELIAHADEGMAMLMRELALGTIPRRLLADLSRTMLASRSAKPEQSHIVVKLSRESVTALGLAAGITADLVEARRIES